VVLPFYQKAVSFCDFMGLFLPKSIKKRGDVSPVGATAFAFGIVKSPCYEFTHSDFTIPTATGRRYIPAKSIVEIKERSCSKVFTFETASTAISLKFNCQFISFSFIHL
jgi:hypothetical protein